MDFVITEADIFKYMIPREDEEVPVRKNLRTLLSRIPMNIFKNEYWILYQALEQAYKYKVVLGYDQYHQILLNNMSTVINNPNVKLFEEESLTDRELQSRLLDYALAEYDSLSLLPLEEDGLEGNLNLYLHSWADEMMRDIAYNQLNIINEGMTFNRKFYKGAIDAKYYAQQAMDSVQALVEGDAEMLSEIIDTSQDSPEEIRRKMQEEEELANPVSNTGLDKVDDEIRAFYKGEIVTIQAGTGVGKTRFAVNIGYNGMKMGRDVLYVTLEQKATRVFPMFLARHIIENWGDYPDLTDKHIIRGMYGFEREPIRSEAEIDLLENENIGKLRIEPRSIKARDLKDYLHRVWDEGFHFDILVLDYIGLIDTSAGSGRYEELTNVINMLKTEVKSFKGEGFLAVIPNQLTAKAEEELAKGVSGAALSKIGGSETQYISRASDYVFTLFQNEDMIKDFEMQIYLSKLRLGEKMPYVMADVKLGSCLFKEQVEDEEDDL